MSEIWKSVVRVKLVFALQQAVEEFEKLRTNLHVYYIGSVPSVDGKWESWAVESASNPFPIQYDLRQASLVYQSIFVPLFAPWDLY